MTPKGILIDTPTEGMQFIRYIAIVKISFPPKREGMRRVAKKGKTDLNNVV